MLYEVITQGYIILLFVIFSRESVPGLHEIINHGFHIATIFHNILHAVEPIHLTRIIMRFNQTITGKQQALPGGELRFHFLVLHTGEQP